MSASPNCPVVRFSEIDPVLCPCGWAQRAFAEVPGAPANVQYYCDCAWQAAGF